jgi:hypothetical protein
MRDPSMRRELLLLREMRDAAATIRDLTSRRVGCRDRRSALRDGHLEHPLEGRRSTWQ